MSCKYLLLYQLFHFLDSVFRNKKVLILMEVQFIYFFSIVACFFDVVFKYGASF